MNGKGWSDEDVYRIAERGHALYLQGKYREAAVIFEGLAAAAPANSYCRDALAAVYLALGEPQRAVDELNRLLEGDPGDLAARQRRCEAYIRLGFYPAARADFEHLEYLLPEKERRRIALELESAFGEATYPPVAR